MTYLLPEVPHIKELEIGSQEIENILEQNMIQEALQLSLPEIDIESIINAPVEEDSGQQIKEDSIVFKTAQQAYMKGAILIKHTNAAQKKFNYKVL